MQGQCTSNASSISQAAALAAITGDQGVVEEMRKAFAVRRELIVSLLRDIDGVSCNMPKGAFYVFPDVSNVLGPHKDALSWAGALLEQEKVALVPGDPFGAPGHIRLSYATSEEQIREGLSRIKRFVESL